MLFCRYRQGTQLPVPFPLVSRTDAMRRSDSMSDTVGTPPIRVVRVVVVDVAAGVHIPLIVRVAAIARTQEHVDSRG